MVGGVVLQVAGAEPAAVILRTVGYAGWLAVVGLLIFLAFVDRRQDTETGFSGRAFVLAWAVVAAAAGVLEAVRGAADSVEAVGLWARPMAILLVGSAAGVGSRAAIRWSAFAGAVGLALWTLGSRSVRDGDVVAAVADYLHIVAAAAWVGVLAGLLVSRTAAGKAAAVGPEAVRRIQDASMIALLSVFALALTGLIQAFAFVDSWDALATTRYGVTLLVKLALVACALAVGGANRWIVLPRIEAREAGSLRSLRDAVIVELVVLMGVVAATALLVHLPG